LPAGLKEAMTEVSNLEYRIPFCLLPAEKSNEKEVSNIMWSPPSIENICSNVLTLLYKINKMKSRENQQKIIKKYYINNKMLNGKPTKNIYIIFKKYKKSYKQYSARVDIRGCRGYNKVKINDNNSQY
jgi:hypothetical protein